MSKKAKADQAFDVMSIFNPQTQPMPLKAIWLKDKIRLGDGRETMRITEGDAVLVSNGELLSCPENEKPTHVITMCHGCVSSNFSINVIDLNSQELSTIQL